MRKQPLLGLVLKSMGFGFLLILILLYTLEFVPRFKVSAENTGGTSMSNCPNGGFELGSECWITGGVLPIAVQSDEKLEGGYAALLGDLDPRKCRGGLPIGEAWLRQRFWVPGDGAPYLSFSYRLISYDEFKFTGPLGERYDHFDVYMDDVSDNLPPFRILRDGSIDGKPITGQDGCTLEAEDKGWITRTWTLSSVTSFDDPSKVYDLRDKTIDLTFINLSRDAPSYDQAWYNTWIYIDQVKLQRSLRLEKFSDPPGPVHEGDLITYTLAYANTGLTTQTMSLTDVLPFNVSLIPNTISPAAELNGSTLVWNLGNKLPGQSGQVSFQVQAPLLPALSPASINAHSASLSTQSPAFILPVPITCDTTHFWANGVTRQPPLPNPYTMQVQLPPGANPSKMWLLMKGTNNAPPTIAGLPAQLVTTSQNSFGASLWSANITTEALTGRQVTVVTQNPRELGAVFLFDQADPPFDQNELDDFVETTKTFTYTLDIPSVTTQTIGVLLPFMDITYLTDDLLPDSRLTTITVQFDGQSHTLTANDPNLGNGLLMTQFPFQIGPLGQNTMTKTLTITVDTEDSIYTLGPRICRPVYIENTAWLCSEQAGCISASVRNEPENFILPNAIYLPIILKSSP